MRIRLELNISSEEKCLQRRLETVQGRRVANGARQPVPCRRTCDDECTSAELCHRPLNYKVAASRRPSSTFNTRTCAELRKICRGQSMHRFVHNQTQYELDALCHRQPMSRSRIKPATREYFSAPQSILAAAFITRCRQSRA